MCFLWSKLSHCTRFGTFCFRGIQNFPKVTYFIFCFFGVFMTRPALQTAFDFISNALRRVTCHYMRYVPDGESWYATQWDNPTKPAYTI